jgi:hypothetical protein
MLEKPSVEALQVLRASITVIMFLTMFEGSVVGQSLAPPSGSIFPAQGDHHAPLPGGIPPTQEGGFAKRHMSPLGKACLTIQGYVKPELANKGIYQHLIKAVNDCGQNIKVQVCYYRTEDCVLMNVPPWESKTSILGIFPALKRFQFEAKEQY